MRVPSLYLTIDEAAATRGARDRRAVIRRNVIASAQEASVVPLRKRWIAPEADDPNNENLYDRFYGVMNDSAIVEQLAFGALLSGRNDLGEVARRWLVGVARTWRPERLVQPDYGTAYAITRLIRALAVGWDLIGGSLAPGDRRLVRSTILDLAGTYWAGWFTQPISAAASAHTHHAHLEWASLGVVALALRDETEDTRTWLEATIEKFRRDLLPHGLADDGAQVEGASFWASTMFYRFLFLDPLRRIVGLDLAAETADRFQPDVSMAAIAGPRRHRCETEAESVVLEPDYAQLGYHAPALVALARLHRSSHLQGLAGWDPWLGRLHDPGHVTRSGEHLRFCLGPYALAWFDPSLPAVIGHERRTFAFPSVGEAYLRNGWEPGGIAVGFKDGRLAVHAGGQPVLVDLTPGRALDRQASVAAGTAIWHWHPADLALTLHSIEQQRDGGVLEASRPASGTASGTLRVELQKGRLRIERSDGESRQWWAAAGAAQVDGAWQWRSLRPTRLRIVHGTVARWAPRGHVIERRVGYGNLRIRGLNDRRRSLTVAEPADDGRLVVEIMVNET